MILARTAERRRSGGALRITALGSSTTEGFGASDPPRTGYPPRLRDALLPHFRDGITLTNRGVSGQTIEGMARQFDDVLGDRPDLVLWQVGSNDGPQGVPLARFETLLTEGARRFAAVADLVLIEPQWSRVLEADPSFPPFLASVRGVGGRAGVPVFPRHEEMRRWAVETGLGIDGLSPDGMHMDDTGYRLLGEAVAGFVLDRS